MTEHDCIQRDRVEANKVALATISTQLDALRFTLDTVRDKICRHINEGEAPKTGYRDRLLIAEQEISVIKQGYWKACIVSGIIGGLLGQGIPKLVSLILKLL